MSKKPSAEKFNEGGPQRLLTEGINDCYVIAALCEHYGISENFVLNNCGGDDKALKKFGALLATESIKTIGLVLDADNPSLKAKWQKFQSILRKARIDCVHNEPHMNGTIIPATSEHPKIGLWLMPDNNIDGMLEDFCINMANPEAINFAQDCVSKAQQQNYTSFIENHHSKAIVHTYLAWQEEPGQPLGQAITAKILNPTNPSASTFANWLKVLFGDT